MPDANGNPTYGDAVKTWFTDPESAVIQTIAQVGSAPSIGDVWDNYFTGHITAAELKQIQDQQAPYVYNATYQNSINQGKSEAQATQDAQDASMAAAAELTNYVNTYEGGTAEKVISDAESSLKIWGTTTGIVILAIVALLALHEWNNA